MRVEFGRGEALVELELDAAGRGVEAELAPGTVVVFPAAMGVGEEVIGKLLDDIFQRQLTHLDLGVVPGQRRVGDLGRGKLDGDLTRPCADAFDLAAVPGADGWPLEPTDFFVSLATPSQDGLTVEHNVHNLRDAVEAFVYDCLEQTHAGWEIDAGAYGTFKFDVAAGTVRLDFHERFEASEHHGHNL